MSIETEEEIINVLKKKAEKIFSENPGSELSPTAIYRKDNILHVVPLNGEREQIRLGIEMIEAEEPEWIATMNEGYSRKFAARTEKEKRELKRTAKNYTPGLNELAFKLGNPDVKEVVMIQVRVNGRNPISVTFDKIRGKLENEYRTTDYSGFLALKKKKSDKDLGDVI